MNPSIAARRRKFPLQFASKLADSIIVLLLFFLTSCASAPAPESVPTFTSTHTFAVTSAPSFTPIPSAATFTPVPPTQTATPIICDPHIVDYCITDGHFVFQRPIKPPDNASVDVTYRYASTANGTRDPHHGVEFLNKFGTPVYAAGDGAVLFANADSLPKFSPWPNYYGNVIVIQHADNLYTLYAHLSKILVQAGESVKVGDEIGEVGQTGVAIGSHLHFEVRRGNVEDYYSTQNPELWLMPNVDANGQLLGVIQISAATSAGQLIKHAEFTIQLYNQNQPPGIVEYGVTYSGDMLKGAEENAAIGDLPSGRYRLVLQYNGQHLERFVEVESGKLTQVLFTVQ
jgi:hypothetical protein